MSSGLTTNALREVQSATLKIFEVASLSIFALTIEVIQLITA